MTECFNNRKLSPTENNVTTIEGHEESVELDEEENEPFMLMCSFVFCSLLEV